MSAAVKSDIARNMTRTIDLDVDIGADAVDYKCVRLPFTRSFAHSSLPVPLPTKSLYLVSRWKCVNWKVSSKRLWTSSTISRNGKRNSPIRTVRPLLPHTCLILHAFPSSVSTNQRVQNFAWFTLFSLVGLGVWEIFHLRAFFKRKYLID